jgi:hypothetical protein
VVHGSMFAWWPADELNGVSPMHEGWQIVAWWQVHTCAFSLWKHPKAALVTPQHGAPEMGSLLVSGHFTGCQPPLLAKDTT